MKNLDLSHFAQTLSILIFINDYIIEITDHSTILNTTLLFHVSNRFNFLINYIVTQNCILHFKFKLKEYFTR